MCYHNSLNKSFQELEAAFDAHFAEPFDYKPIFHGNGFTFLKWPVITAEQPHIIQLFHWGLIPFWCKTMDAAQEMRKNTLNAVSETIFTKPSFKHCLKHQRCLVLSSGFFEWQTLNKKKYPYFISLRSRELFAFAGLYDTFTDKQTGEVIQSFSILTTHANVLMEKIHNSRKRMPVILSKNQERQWLQQDMEEEDVRQILKPYDVDDMQAYTISRLITSRLQDSNTFEVLAPFSYKELTD